MLHVFHVKLLQGGFQKAHQRSKHAVQKILKKRNLLKFPDLCEIPGNYTLEKKKLCFEVSVSYLTRILCRNWRARVRKLVHVLVCISISSVQ